MDKPFAHLPLQPQEVAIRTLGVSLVAIAAVAASMTLARHRGDPPQTEARPAPDEARPLALEMNLDAIRTAGL